MSERGEYLTAGRAAELERAIGRLEGRFEQRCDDLEAVVVKLRHHQTEILRALVTSLLELYRAEIADLPPKEPPRDDP